MSRTSDSSGRYFFLLCSAAILLLSWMVQPEAAREWFRVHLWSRLSGGPGAAPSAGMVGTSEGSLQAPDKPPLDARKVTLYLPSRASPGLLEAVEASIGAAESPKELVVEAVGLLQAPPPESGLEAAVPPGTRVLAVFLDGQRLIVDLSQEFLSRPPASVSASRQSFYAIVNTLTSLPFAEEVRFLVANEERTTYFDTFDLTAAYRFNPEVVGDRGVRRQ